MRDLGNTLIVVEHDEETMRNADYLVDIGPGAGVHGGQRWSPPGASKTSKRAPLPLRATISGGPEIHRHPRKKDAAKAMAASLAIEGAKCHNLKNISVKIPLGEFVVVTGVSGSGQEFAPWSTRRSYKATGKETLGRRDFPRAPIKIRSKASHHIDKVVNVTQEPIGRTPRSNPATYTKVFDDIRDLFSSDPRRARKRASTKAVSPLTCPEGAARNAKAPASSTSR
jgi:excinuclease ABC subunit A